LLIAAMGERLLPDERKLFRKLTGRDHEPGQRVEELVGVIGRRGGKSRAIACLASYIAGLVDHRALLAAGERGVVLCIAPDQRQAKIILDYAEAAFNATSILRPLIRSRTQDTLSLTTGIDIEVRAASFRRLRGPTFIAVIADEGAFFFLADEGAANSDSEILDAVRPGLATTGGLLAVLSSPYAKRGELYELHKRHYGPQGDPLVLVAQGESRIFNPTLPQSVVDRALSRDPQAASAEYLAKFRDDIESFIGREVVDACVDVDVRERPYVAGGRYLSFTDPSGGSSDSMTIAIGHRERDILVVDCLREITPPFDPESATDEFAQILKNYGLSETTGDRYAAQWVVGSFQRAGIKYRHSEQTRSQLYLEMLPRLNAKTIKLLDHPRSISQICMLERRAGRGSAGRDVVDHPKGAKDDIANAIAGLCGLAGVRMSYDTSLNWVSGDENELSFVQQRRNAYVASGGRIR
jgi:hypothetical protein